MPPRIVVVRVSDEEVSTNASGSVKVRFTSDSLGPLHGSLRQRSGICDTKAGLLATLSRMRISTFPCIRIHQFAMSQGQPAGGHKSTRSLHSSYPRCQRHLENGGTAPCSAGRPSSRACADLDIFYESRAALVNQAKPDFRERKSLPRCTSGQR